MICISCDSDQHSVLRELLEITAEWRSLATTLEIPLREIRAIEINHSGDVKACVVKMVERWFELQPSKLSWNTLCAALREPLVGRPDIAKAIEHRYHVSS